MKNVWILSAILAGILSFAACTGDDMANTNGGTGNTGEVQGAEQASVADMFIGKWTGYGEWTFNEDGTCSYEYYEKHDGHWTYAPETNTLITDILEWNWKIIAVTESMWTGEHLAGKKDTYTYSRVEAE